MDRPAEAEEDSIIFFIRAPGKDICLHILHTVRLDARLVECDYFLCGVDGGDLLRMLAELGCPQAGTAGELQHAALRLEGIKHPAHLFNLSEPLPVQFLAAVVTAFAQEPLVVFAGARLIIAYLLVEQLPVIRFFHITSLFRASMLLFYRKLQAKGVNVKGNTLAEICFIAHK